MLPLASHEPERRPRTRPPSSNHLATNGNIALQTRRQGTRNDPIQTVRAWPPPQSAGAGYSVPRAREGSPKYSRR